LGNVYVADTFNSTIRRIAPDGVVSTLAGSPGQSGSVDGMGAVARLSYPEGVAADDVGNVYVADTGNQSIRRISPGGAVTTLAGSANPNQYGTADGIGADARFYNPNAVAVDGLGYVYVADSSNCTIRKISPGGVVTTLAGNPGESGNADGIAAAARFTYLRGVTVDGSGNVYVSDNFTIRKIAPDGLVTTLAGTAGQAGSVDGIGSAARFSDPGGVTVDEWGNIYVSDSGNHTIRKVALDGVVSTLAGSPGQSGGADGLGAASRFNRPTSVAVDRAGSVYVADYWNHTVRVVAPDGVVSTLAGNPGQSGGADGVGAAARFGFPEGEAVDSAGNVYVADTLNHTIRKVTPDGAVRTLAGSAGQYGSTDGAGAEARFDHPAGVAVDQFGYVYVADKFNRTIRRITPDGVVSTLAGSAWKSGSADGAGADARFSLPSGVAVDGAGNIYVADTDNCAIRKITPSGMVSTLAGGYGHTDGTGAAAGFSYPQGVAVDRLGTVYVADDCSIRKVTPEGVVSTLAGSLMSCGSADGTGSASRFYHPRGIALDRQGNVYVADSGNNAVRKITASGVVSTVVGILRATLGNVPGPLPASVIGPYGLAINQETGSLYLGVPWAVMVASNDLVISPAIASIAPAGTKTFTASGGSGDYVWSLSNNNSGGSITSGGVYTAGPNSATTDTITVNDAGGGGWASMDIAVIQTCECRGTGPGGAPVAAICGQSACGSDYTLYSCGAQGWTWTGQTCSGGSGGAGGSTGGTTCECSGTGPGGVPVTTSCGQSACGSDFITYACEASGWSWTGAACGGGSGGAGGSTGGSTCQCSGTGPGGVPVTTSCGQSACGSDFITYSCRADGWAWTGQVCSSGSGGAGGSGGSSGGTACECIGTGLGGVPISASCYQIACGADTILYSCGPEGWAWTGQACNQSLGSVGGTNSFTVTMTIGPSGGIFVLGAPDTPLAGYLMEVASGAVSQATPISVTALDHVPIPDLLPISKSIQSGSAAPSASPSVVLSIPFPPAQAADELPMILVEGADGTIDLRPGLLMDSSAGWITTAMDGTSTYTVVIPSYSPPRVSDTGFKPEADGFYCNNSPGSPCSDGACAGMTTFADWYFRQRRSADGPLRDKFHNQNDPSNFGDACHQTYELTCNLLQHAYPSPTMPDCSNMVGPNLGDFEFQRRFNRINASFARYVLAETGRPVFLALYGRTAYPDEPGFGHSVLAIAQDEVYLKIYDPNAPLTTRPFLMGALSGNVDYVTSDGYHIFEFVCAFDQERYRQMGQYTQARSYEGTYDEMKCTIDGQVVLAAASASPVGDGACQICDPFTSQSRWTQAPAGMPCDDGDPATSGDSCDLGICHGLGR
jgi:sugar lactone lactonase YvrE